MNSDNDTALRFAALGMASARLDREKHHMTPPTPSLPSTHAWRSVMPAHVEIPTWPLLVATGTLIVLGICFVGLILSDHRQRMDRIRHVCCAYCSIRHTRSSAGLGRKRA
jgi:hypothetical protein